MPGTNYIKTLSRAHKIAAVISLIITLIIVVIFSLFNAQLEQQTQRQQQQYAQQLADQTAYMAGQLLLSDSRIGLSVLAQETLTKAHASHIYIFDGNNNIIAEAGKQTYGNSYRASILFQENIVGYLEIEFPATSDSGVPWLIFFISLAIIILCYGLCYGVSHKTIASLEHNMTVLLHQQRHDISHSIRQNFLTHSSLKRYQALQQPAQLLLAIRFTNRRGAPLTITSAQDQQLLQQNMAIISRVMKIYGGQHTPYFEGEIIRFNTSSTGYFNALCAAILIRSLFEASANPQDHSDIALALDLESLPDDTPRPLMSRYRHHQDSQTLYKANQLGEIVLDRSLLTQPIIAERAQIASDENDDYRLLSLSPVYQKLIDNQLKQLG